MVILGAHRFDQADARDRIAPEEAVHGHLARIRFDEKVELGSVQRAFRETFGDRGAVAGNHVMSVCGRLRAVP